MLFSRVKNFKLRDKFNSNEYKSKINKYVRINLLKGVQLSTIPFLFESFYHQSRKNKSSFKIRITRRCLFTNRPNGIYTQFNLSRNTFRELAQFGIIPGYKKAVW